MEHSDTQRENNTISVADALEKTLETTGQTSGSSSRAARAWYEANGNTEAKHTVGVFLKQDDAGDTLYVYIDSAAILQDFSANKMIYLARLEASGFNVTDIQFKLSKYKKRNQGAKRSSQGQQVKPAPLPELEPGAMDEIDEAVQDLPPALAAAVSKAAESAKRRQRLQGDVD